MADTALLAHNHLKPAGFPVIVSAPSGTGKSTVCRRLLGRDRTLRLSVSCTTRLPRPGEKSGRDYHFLSVPEFKRKIHKDEFLEWASVHDQYYGTPRAFLESQLAAGRVVLLAIDVQGAKSLRQKRPDAVTIFLMPPSWRSLEERLKVRTGLAGSGPLEPVDSVGRRLAHAPAELSRARFYDYLVVNDELGKAVRQIECILAAERLKTSRQDLSSFGMRELTAVRR